MKNLFSRRSFHLLLPILVIFLLFPAFSAQAKPVTVSFYSLKSGVTAPSPISVEEGTTYREAFNDHFGNDELPSVQGPGNQILIWWRTIQNDPSFDSAIDLDAQITSNISLYACWAEKIETIGVHAAIPLDGEILLPQCICTNADHYQLTGARFLDPSMSQHVGAWHSGDTVILELTFRPEEGYGFASIDDTSVTEVRINGRYCMQGLDHSYSRAKQVMVTYIDFTVPAPGGTFTLPDSLEELGEEALAFTKAQTIIVPEGTKTLGTLAFGGCSSLQRIILPDSIESIAPDAFLGCHTSLMIISDSTYVRNFAEQTEIVVYHEPKG